MKLDTNFIEFFYDEEEMPLYKAVRCLDVSMVELFLRDGANPNICRVIKKTIEYEYETLLTVLKYYDIYYGRCYTSEDYDRIEAEKIRNKENKIAILKLLIKYGINIDIKIKNGPTKYRSNAVIKNGPPTFLNSLLLPLITIDEERKEMIKIALKAGAIPSKERCFEIISGTCPENLKFLVENGVNFDKHLHFLVEKRKIEFIKILLESGANVNIKDVCGKTPLYYAKHFQDNEIIEILTKNGAVDIVEDVKECVKKNNCSSWFSKILNFNKLT